MADNKVRSAEVGQAASDAATQLRAYTVDKQFTGAFPGGAPLLTEEAARRILKDPEKVRASVRRRMREFEEKARGY